MASLADVGKHTSSVQIHRITKLSKCHSYVKLHNKKVKSPGARHQAETTSNR